MRTQTTNIDTRIYVGGPNYSGGGSDSNDGTSIATCLATINEAVNRVKGDLDLYRDTIVTIELLGSSYAGNIHFPAALVGGEGGGRLRILGSYTNPYRVLLTSNIQETVGVYTDAMLRLEHLALQNTCPTGGNCLNVDLNAGLFLRDILFYDATDYHISVARGGIVEFEASSPSLAIPGSQIAAGGNAKGFVRVNPLGHFAYNNTALTLLGGVAFSEAFVTCDQGRATFQPTITGGSNATGQRYCVRNNGVIKTPSGDVNYLPGSSAGSSSAGGLYC